MEPVRVHYKTTVSQSDDRTRLDTFVHNFPFEELDIDLLP